MVTDLAELPKMCTADWVGVHCPLIKYSSSAFVSRRAYGSRIVFLSLYFVLNGLVTR